MSTATCPSCERLRALNLRDFLAQTTWAPDRDRWWLTGDDYPALVLGNDPACNSTISVELPMLAAVAQ